MQPDGLEQLVEPTWTQRLPRTDGQQASQHADVVCTERLPDLLLLILPGLAAIVLAATTQLRLITWGACSGTAGPAHEQPADYATA